MQRVRRSIESNGVVFVNFIPHPEVLVYHDDLSILFESF